MPKAFTQAKPPYNGLSRYRVVVHCYHAPATIRTYACAVGQYLFRQPVLLKTGRLMMLDASDASLYFMPPPSLPSLSDILRADDDVRQSSKQSQDLQKFIAFHCQHTCALRFTFRISFFAMLYDSLMRDTPARPPATRRAAPPPCHYRCA